MSIIDLLPTVRALSRLDRLRLIQIVVQELATDEAASLIEPNREYPVWSPYEADKAAAVMLQLLDVEKCAT
jgi:hypothetical protein